MTQHLVAYTDASAFGGAEHVLATLLADVATRRRVTVVGVSQDVVRRIAGAHESIETVLLPPVGTKRDLREIAVHIRALRRLAPSIVQVNLRTPYAAQWGLLAAILAPGSRVVAVEHLPLHSYSAGTRWFKRHTSRRLAAHVAVGERTAREVEADAALPAGSIRVIRNGVAAPAGVIAERLAPSPVIGGIGRLDTQKGFDVLVRTLPSLEGGVTAVVVGDGPAAGELKQLAQAEGVLERFVLAGPRASARAALLGLDVFVLSSRFEGLPLVVLEAMASRVPVVATDVGSVREAITDGETGLLVPPESPDALARAIGRLLEDAALKARLVEQAYAVWADRFDVARMIRDYESLYAEVGG